MTREYGQYCGLARALDLVGSRWSLLIVRELLDGPRRFTDLEQRLTGIPTNILSTRLRELEEGSVIERSLQPRPFGAVVYGLTPYGKSLEKPLLALGLWGAQSLGRPEPGAVFSLGSLTFALRAMFQEDAKGDHYFQVRAGDDCLNVSVANGTVSFPHEPPGEPDVVLKIGPEMLLAMLKGYETFDSAIESGKLQIHGPADKARQFFEIFRMPDLVEAPR
jgi:DNA-binding HxlR family transcriptional regulator/putative sterol carrier protein